ncbi:TIM barrel protein, partial [Candidatus Woesearchaeota archaeon]|nr:TIM barrel protein [Candidatus Woesearchaeota archaeon]
MKVGIKIYSHNVNYIRKGIDFVDFLDVLPEPNFKIDPLKEYSIPFVVHAPHFAFNVNPADAMLKQYNLDTLRSALRAADTLEADKVIVHPGELTNNHTSLQNSLSIFRELDDARILIENLPYAYFRKVAGHQLCSNPQELKYFCHELGLNVCFDLGHACATAATMKSDYKSFVKEFFKLKISHFHLSDSKVSSES